MRNTPVPRPESVSLNIDGKTIAGIRHRVADTDAATKVLCLHGWLDNANSFLPMMSLLPEIDLLAIDFPGHGFSDHLDSAYTMTDSAYWATAAIKAIGWERCHIMGHSMGGIIAPLVAASVPDIIESLILIESSGAITNEADEFVERLQKSMNDRLAPHKYASKLYASKNEAVDARLRAAKMEAISARLIIDRQVSEFQDGWRWRFDPKLRVSTAHRLTDAHVKAVNESLSCPVLTIVAKDGYLTSRPETAERLGQIKNHKTVTLAGNHHLHMDTPEPVATAVNQFLGTRPAMGG